MKIENAEYTEKSLANELIDFIQDSPTAAHCVSRAEQMLMEEGFFQIEEKDKWKLKSGDKFYVIKHDTAMIAGIIGSKPVSEAGFKIIGSHTDSPGFKLKPVAVKKSFGYSQLGVEVYGGPLFSTWTDRDLGLAGRAMLKADNKDGFISKNLAINRPIARIPQLAIHYNREANTALNLNPQTHLVPIIGLSEEEINDELIKDLVAKELNIASEEIINYELYLYDLQKGVLAGINEEFIASGRIDNQSMVHSSVRALLDSKGSEATHLIALYDSEEVGSSTTNGGNSSFTKDILYRLSISENDKESFHRALANTVFISADGAHAIHPNYPEKFESKNLVYVNKGPVIKINARTSYASTVESSSIFELIAKKADVPCQKFVNRSDIRGGGTIGSMIATNLGIRCVDIGNAMIAMHSIREVCGVKDHHYMTKVLTEFFS